MYDVVVIGAGPAGLAAAVYLARQKMNFLIVTGDVGGKTLWSADVENYLGFHLLDGVDLVKKFRAHLNDYQDGVELHEGELVQSVEKIAGGFRIPTTKGVYETRSVLVATGEDNRKLNVPGETQFFGRGLTYCAACDAPLFRDKIVHVIGGGNSATDAALFLAKYATRVTMIALSAKLSGDERLIEKCLADSKVAFFGETKTTKIVGETMVTGIGLVGPDGIERVEPTQGVFVEIGLVPVSQFVASVAKTKAGEIIVDKYNQTSVPGIFAAGDVTDVTAKQIAVAVGEGSKAALGIIKYLQTTPV